MDDYRDLLAAIDPKETAYFLDFDGTLAEIVDDPDAATIRATTLATIARLGSASGGAVAVISGRSIAQLDRMLHPHRLPLAGVHGLERRGADGSISRVAVDGEAHERLAFKVRSFVAGRPGLLAEMKPGSVALHYRKRPELEDECLRFAAQQAQRNPRLSNLKGKKVVEMKLAACNKGDAIAEFMNETPFRGRKPFFAGDDVTDEMGFDVVNALGGVSLKVGGGETVAVHRIADPASLAVLLNLVAAPADFS